MSENQKALSAEQSLPPRTELSALVCEHCNAPIAADDKHAVCTDPWGGNVSIICEHCQERAYDRHQERLMEDGPGPSLLEQQQAAWRLK
jgi:RNase P subunit RPR2